MAPKPVRRGSMAVSTFPGDNVGAREPCGLRVSWMVYVRLFLGVGMLSFFAACSVPPEKRAPATSVEIASLSAAIRALSPSVDPEEADRAAEIAYTYTRELAIAYEITDTAIVHNMKVNAGMRPRGLCWHWAEDMESRLDAEGFETLEMHRAIANHDTELRIDHSTAIILARGENWDDGIVLDPWRLGGRLTWVPVLDDARYDWVNRDDVLDWKRRQLIAEGRLLAPG